MASENSMLSRLMLSALLIAASACGGGAFKGTNGRKSPGPAAPAKVASSLDLEFVSANALFKNCLYYSLDSGEMRLYGCNHTTKLASLSLTAEGGKCLEPRFELKSYAPVDSSACIKKLKADPQAVCDYQTNPIKTTIIGESINVVMTVSKDGKKRTYSFEDSYDNDINDYIFTATSKNGDFCSGK